MVEINRVLHHFRAENWNAEWDKVDGSQLKWSPDLNLSRLYFSPWWFMEIMESIEHYLSEATLTGVIQIRNMPFTCKDAVITSIYMMSDDANVKGLWMGQKDQYDILEMTETRDLDIIALKFAEIYMKSFLLKIGTGRHCQRPELFLI